MANEHHDSHVADLPTGWVWATIGEIAKQINSGFPSGQHNKESRGIPHLRPMNVSPKGEIDLADLKYVEAKDYDPLLKGDVLFNNTNSPVWVGKTAYIKQDTNWAYSNHMTRIRLLDTGLSSAWVAYSLHYLFVTGYFRLYCRHHVNQASINTGFLSEVRIPLAPLPEQHRIVAKIEEQFTRLDAGVAALKRAQANLKRYKAAVLKAACEGRLVAQDASDEPASELLKRILAERRAKWAADLRAKGKDPQKAKYEEPESLDVENLPALPDKWCWTGLGSLFPVTIGGTPSRQKEEYWNGDIPWVSSGEVRNERIKATREMITTAGRENSNAKLHKPGTVLLAMIGEGKTRGQAAILDIPATTNQNIASILCSETPILPEWVFYWLMSRYEQTRKSGSGGMQYALNSARIRGFAFPLPPLAEQRRIVAEVERRLSVVQELDATLTANLARAERLRQSILKRAFEGKL